MSSVVDLGTDGEDEEDDEEDKLLKKKKQEEENLPVFSTTDPQVFDLKYNQSCKLHLPVFCSSSVRFY